MQFKTYPLQVSGHRPLLKRNKYLFKPFQLKEFDFYRNAPLHSELLSYIPTFYGIIYITEDGSSFKEDDILSTKVSSELINREISLTRRFFLYFCNIFLFSFKSFIN